MAGIKVAESLVNEGIDVVVLEVADYVGGRMQSFEFCGETVEAGAGWVHGVHEKGDNTNPIWKLAKEINLRGTRNHNYIVRDSANNGKDITKQYKECRQELDEFTDKLLSLNDNL